MEEQDHERYRSFYVVDIGVGYLQVTFISSLKTDFEILVYLAVRQNNRNWILSV